MAWRDSRASRRRLGLYSLSIVLGIAALVAVGSFSENLRRAIGDQTKSLLGADLVVTSRQAFSPEVVSYLDSNQICRILKHIHYAISPNEIVLLHNVL